MGHHHHAVVIELWMAQNCIDTELACGWKRKNPVHCWWIWTLLRFLFWMGVGAWQWACRRMVEYRCGTSDCRCTGKRRRLQHLRCTDHQWTTRFPVQFFSSWCIQNQYHLRRHVPSSSGELLHELCTLRGSCKPFPYSGAAGFCICCPFRCWLRPHCSWPNSWCPSPCQPLPWQILSGFISFLHPQYHCRMLNLSELNCSLYFLFSPALLASSSSLSHAFPVFYHLWRRLVLKGC